MSNKKKILVTGGSGFIGSALVKRLVRLEYDVVVFDNNSRGSKDRLHDVWNDIEFVEGDIRDSQSVMKASHGCSDLIHCAFVNGTKFFYEKPKLVLDVGVKGAINTLEAAIENKMDSYILASSSEVYQQPENIPTSEDERCVIPDVFNPRYSYAGGKLISELLTINYLRDCRTESCIFRPHNVFGPNMGFEHVIPELVKKMYIASNSDTKKEIELTIQGTGEETRAFCYVEDSVDQIIAIFDHGKDMGMYHVGMNKEISIKKLIVDIGEILDLTVSIRGGELREGGTTRRCPSIKAIENIGYVVKNSYDKGLEKTVRWYWDFYKQQDGKIE